ncbi:MAG TPA: LEA type 2 family protein [Pyrinomonadaceae bacterium]|nr:LEA type 2 family protein [Pyrinomonadaceae bacterium]
MRRFFAVRTLAVRVLALALFAAAFAAEASAQRIPVERLGGSLVKMKVGEITLEAVDFRDQTATLNLALDVSNGLLPVTLRDFDYRLRLNGHDTISGVHDGSLKIGGRSSSRVNLPVTVHLRSIPGAIWSAFRNRGQVQYDLDTAFTLPLYVTERRFDRSFSGEVPLRSVVDAATILRASRLGDGGGAPSRDRGGFDIRDIFGF